MGGDGDAGSVADDEANGGIPTAVMGARDRPMGEIEEADDDTLEHCDRVVGVQFAGGFQTERLPLLRVVEQRGQPRQQRTVVFTWV